MLISKKYKFIFIHIPKVAGQSVTRALAPFGTGRWQGKVNLLLSSRLAIPQSSMNRLHLYHPHITAEELSNLLGKNEFNSYFSFAVVRNPWEWLVSVYNYTLKNPRNGSHQFIKSLGGFDQYLQWLSNHEVDFFQKKFIFHQNGEQLVDYIARYEKLDEDFQQICSKLNLTAELPHLNLYRTQDYRDYYDHSNRELVHQIFKDDIETFGYNFE